MSKNKDELSSFWLGFSFAIIIVSSIIVLIAGVNFALDYKESRNMLMSKCVDICGLKGEEFINIESKRVVVDASNSTYITEDYVESRNFCLCGERVR